MEHAHTMAKEARLNGRRALSIFLSVVMILSTVCFFNPGWSFTAKAAITNESTTQTASSKPHSLALNVPESIYLAPGSANFEYFMTDTLTADGAAANKYAASSATVSLSCADATSVSLSYAFDYSKTKTVTSEDGNRSAAATSGLSLNVDNAALGTKTGTTDVLFMLDGSDWLTGYTPAMDGTEYFIKWTASYVINGTTYTTYAYTSVYVPYLGQAGASLWHSYNAGGVEPESWAYSFITGGNYVSGGNYRSNFLSTDAAVDASATAATGNYVAPLVSFTGGNAGSNGGDVSNPFSNRATVPWGSSFYNTYTVSSQANGGVWVDNWSDTGNGGWNEYLGANDNDGDANTDGVLHLNVDLSRFTDYRQIPNLSAGWAQYRHDWDGKGNRLQWIAGVDGASPSFNGSETSSKTVANPSITTSVDTSDDKENESVARGLYELKGTITGGTHLMMYSYKNVYSDLLGQAACATIASTKLDVTATNKAELRRKVFTYLTEGYSANMDAANGTAFMNALSNASAVLADVLATQSEIDAAVTALNAAYNNSRNALTSYWQTPTNVAFYVPEAIYLAPVSSSWGATTSSSFQYYIQNTVNTANIYTQPTTNTNADTSGRVYFAYPNVNPATISLSYKYLNVGGTTTLSGGSVTVGSMSAENNYYKATISGGTSPSLGSATTGCYIEWTATFTDPITGQVKSAIAYTYVYKPYVVPVVGAGRVKNTGGGDSYGQQLTWLTGIHSVNTGVSYTNKRYARYTTSNNGKGMLGFLSNSASSGTATQPLFSALTEYNPLATRMYATFATETAATSYFYANQTGSGIGNVGSDSWLSATANATTTVSSSSTFDVASADFCDCSRNQDHLTSQLVVGPRGVIKIDTSRYSNLAQIPNLGVGLLVTDDEGSDNNSGSWYVADYTGLTTYKTTQSWTGSGDKETIWNDCVTIIARQGKYSARGAYEREGIKYAGAWVAPVSASDSSKTYSVKGLYSNYDSDYILNSVIIDLEATQYNKANLRAAVNSAVNAFSTLGLEANYGSQYYNTSSSYWTTFVNAYKAAELALTTVDGSIANPNTLAANLNSALASLLAGNGLKSCTAVQQNLAIVNEGNGDTLRAIESSQTGSHTISYKGRDNVTFTGDALTGYTFAGMMCSDTAWNTATLTEGRRLLNSGSLAYITNYSPYTSEVTTGTGTISFSKNSGESFETNGYINGSTAEYQNVSDDALYYYYFYDAHQYTINYNANGGVGTTAPSVHAYGVAKALTANAFTRAGYVFTGWNTAPGGNGTAYANSASVTNLTAEDGATITLYAQWTPDLTNQPVLTVDSADGTATSNLIYPYALGTAVNYAGGNASSISYSIVNNSTSFDISGQYTDGIAERTTMLPLWVYLEAGKTYSINFTADNNFSNFYFFKDGSHIVRANVRAGEEFTVGVRTTSDCTWENNSDITGYYQLRLDEDCNNAGSAASVQPYSITGLKVVEISADATNNYKQPAESTVVLENPVRAGYTFAGWSGATSGTLNSLGNGTLYTFGGENDTLTATWTKGTYTLGYDNLFYFADWAAKAVPVYSTDTASFDASTGTYTFKTGNTINGIRMHNSVYSADAAHIAVDESTEYSISYEVTNNKANTNTNLFIEFYNAAGEMLDVDDDSTIDYGADSGGSICKYIIYYEGVEQYTSTRSFNGHTLLSGTYSEDVGVVAGSGDFGKTRVVFKTPANTTYMTLAFGNDAAGMTSQVRNIQLVKLEDYLAGENGHTGAVSYDVTGKAYDVDSGTFGTLTTPTRTGYTFGGWFTEKDGAGTQITADTAVDAYLGNTTVYSDWTANQYTIAFNKNYSAGTGSGSTASVTANYDTAVNLTANGFVRDGYTFVGWNTLANGSGTSYADGASVMNLAAENGATVTLYAQWTANTDTQYKIEYYLKTLGEDTYTLSAESTQTLTGTTATTATASGADIKSFTGFTYNAAASTASGTIAGDGSLVLKLYYTRNSYGVSYSYTGTVPAGATALPSTASYEYGATVTVAEAAQAPGYIFSGWSKTGTFTMEATAVSITGSFSASTYTINFDGSGATGGTTASVTASYDSPCTLTTNGFTKTGYVFTGWATTAGGPKVYSDGASVTNLVDSGSTTLYAVWKAITYKIAFNNNGGSGVASTVTATYDTACNIPTSGFIKTGYTFAGWNTAADGSGTDCAGTALNLTAVSGETVTLYAQYTANTDTAYKIRYYLKNLGTGTYTESAASAENRTGTTGATVTVSDADIKSFTGFTYDAAASTASGTIAGDGSLVLKLYYTRDTHVVTYSYTGEVPAGASELPAAASYEYGATVAVAAAASATGYDFSGWNKTGTFTMGTEDVVISGSWTVKEYTITFNANGGTPVGDATYAYGATVTAPTAPTKTGYTFASWSPALPSTMPAEDYATTAQWTANTYTIVYNANTGAGSMVNQPIAYDTSAALTDNAFTKTGYAFAGWNTAADGTGTAYTDGQTVSNLTAVNGEEITLYAQWTADTDTAYTIEYYLKDVGADTYTKQDGATVSHTGTTDTEATASAADIKSFTGFTYNAAASTVSGTIAGDGSLVLKLYYTRNSHDVSYAYAGETPADATALPATAGYEYGAAVTVAVAATATGYNFGGWDHTDFAMPDEDVTITGTWAKNSYTITYITAGGTPVDTQSYEYGETVVAPTAPTRTGYDFAGWSPALPTTMPANNLTLTAQWDAKEYTITFETDGGTEVAAITQDYGTAITAPENPTKTGYIFTGWDTEIPTTMPASDMTITAQWEIRSYNLTVTYVTEDGASVPEAYTAEVTYGAEYSVASPEVTGYTADSATVAGTMPADDVSVTVNYALNSYDLTVNYTTEDGESVPEAYTASIKYKSAYSVASPEVTGYTADIATVAGTMPADDVEVTVNYALNSYDLTVNYTTEDGESAPEAYTASVKYKSAYSVASPEVTGYTADTATVAGTMPAANVTETVNYTLNSYDVTYYVDGTEMYKDTYKYKADVTARAAEEKEGYTFSGWSEIPTTMPAENVTVEGSFSVKSYTLTVNYVTAYEEDAPAAYTEKVEYGTDYSVLSPEVTGYTADIATVTGTMPADDVSVTVSYDLNSYDLTVNYTTEDGESVPEAYTASVKYKSAYSVDSPAVVGYTAGTATVAGTMPAANVTETVNYTLNSYDVTYYVDGTEMYKDTYKYKADVTARAAEEREGYTFSGWSEIPTTMPAGNVTVEGSFSVKSYTLTVSYVTAYEEDAPAAYTEKVEYGTDYSVLSPEVTGYTADIATVTGTMPANDVSVTVNYDLNSYDLTVNYTTEDGESVPETYTARVKYKSAYSVDSPAVVGYTAGTATVAGTMPAANVTETVNYTLNSYDVTYYVDGTEMYKDTYKYKADVTARAAEEKEGYTFSGWSEIPATMPASDVTVTGSFAINGYTITYISDGEEYAVRSYQYGDTVSAVAEPTKTGYTFTGWDAEIPKTMPANDITVTATWAINEYTITFETDGGTDVEAITQNYGTAISAPTDPTKTGYTFAGWDTTIPSTMPAENLTITALWTVNEYTITFDANGGEPVDAITADYGTAVTAPENPTRTGYTFAGWDKAIPSTMPAEDMTITASWTANTYTIVYDANTGSGSMSGTAAVYDEEVTLADNTFTKAGYDFAGWSTEADGTVVYNDGAAVSNLTAQNGDTVTLYAKWTNATYNVTYTDADGVDAASCTPLTATGDTQLTSTVYAADGYHLTDVVAVSIGGGVTTAYTYELSADKLSATLTVDASAVVGDVTVTAAAAAHDYTDHYAGVDGEDTHKAFCSCGAYIVEDCSGGSATCTECAVCEKCGTTYGEPDGHHFTEEAVDARYLKAAATCCDAAVYYKSCSVCGEAGTDTFTYGDVDLANHFNQQTGEAYPIVTDAAVQATCTSTGFTEGSHCSGCGTVIVAQVETPVNPDNHGGHGTYNNVVTAATCTDTGVMGIFCEGCDGLIGTEVIPVNPSNHGDHGTHEVVITPATCSVEGVMGIYCDGCGELLSTRAIAVDPDNHDYDTHNAVVTAATCTDTGVMGIYCDGCGELIGTEVIPVDANNHGDHGTYEAVITEATCAQAGSMGIYCSGCNALVGTTEIAALEHDWGEGVVTKEPKCSEEGIRTFTCSRCGDTYTEAIPATEHTIVRDPAADPSCTVSGLTEGSHCVVCGEIIVPQEVIPALGHDIGEWTVVSAATCLNDGVSMRHCSRCDYSETRIEPALGHDMQELTGTSADGSYSWVSQACVRGDFATSAITATLTNADGTPLADTEMTLIDGTGARTTVTTDSDGKFTVNLPGQGTYKLIVPSGQYETLSIYLDPNGTPSITYSIRSTDCHCICHTDSVWALICRFIYSLINVIFHTDYRCCPDMENFFGHRSN